MRYIKLLLLVIVVGCSSTKELKGYFENLEESSEFSPSSYSIHIKNSKEESSFDRKGNFKLKYPKEGGTIVVKTDENYPVLEKVIPRDAKEVIILVDDVREMMSFVNKEENFDSKYEKALEKFKLIIVVPDQYAIYPGCENVGESKYQKCFQRKINKHVVRKFNAGIANEIGLPEGVKRLLVVFEINKLGKIDIISIKAPHPRLKKEVERIVKILPVMKPGEKRNKPIKLRYALPITFRVQ
ncbi:hypothetical protein [Tenacibaculum jejuense]|uniref:Probable lipoprotein n=1 Tax=Tenacibaculum jejuense TaxID=584609 RepID=A0A238U7C7_9FLAO|nr:hypothetical protein [Tenacibaculum jejuense]SNR15101.1 Probable lipoprotein precursor [Tenacibaculum jejuense]